MDTGNPTIIIDDGSNQIKTVWLDGENIRCEVFPARLVRRARMDVSGDKKMLSTYRVGNSDYDKYTVTDNFDNPISTDIAEEYQVSKYNLILVHEALRRFGFGGQNVNIVTTLPVSLYYSEDEKNQALIDRKTENLLRRDIHNLAGQELANIVGVEVKPESIPAWFDTILNDDGSQKITAGSEHQIMTVDIGGTTTDISVVNGLGASQGFVSHDGGVYQIGGNLKRILISESEFDSLEVFEIERALKSKSFDGNNINEFVNLACDETVTDIINKMRHIKKESKSLAAVVYAGGGSALIGKTLANKYGGKSLFGDQFSVARGLLKMYIHKGGVRVESAQ